MRLLNRSRLPHQRLGRLAKALVGASIVYKGLQAPVVSIYEDALRIGWLGIELDEHKPACLVDEGMLGEIARGLRRS